MAKTRWLGIDPGLAIIGWAILEGNGNQFPQLLDYGIIETDKTLPTPARLMEIEADLGALIAEFRPQFFAIEMPFFSRKIKAAGGVMQALGVINVVIYRMTQALPVFLHQSSWKCHLASGKATKGEIAMVVQELFHLESLPIDDSVDAIAIALAGYNGLENNIEN